MVKVAAVDELIEAAPEDVGFSPARLGNVTRLVDRYISGGRLAGAITMVARRGKVVHFETYGSMDVEAGKQMAPDTIFRMYSMTKPIASVALMTLFEEGLFQLDDPASKFIPQLKGLKVFAGETTNGYDVRDAAREMTVRDLLMHTSGLTAAGDTPVGRLYREAQLNGSSSKGTLADMIEKVGRLPLKCDPGAEWNYGISTDVVGYLCEVLSGQRLDDFLAERIFEPLGMDDTAFTLPPEKVDRFAANYRFEESGPPYYVLGDAPAESAYAKPRSYLSAAGGLVSTAADYMRFAKMLANGGELDGRRIIGPRTLKLMTLNHLPDGKDLGAMNRGSPSEMAREGIGFGLGFAVLLDPAQAQVLGTPGEYYWNGAASTAFFVSPAEDLIVLFLTQLMPSSTYPIRRELRATVYQAIVD
jgi:CubicO group peptidase (beta-lactamase class C family)